MAWKINQTEGDIRAMKEVMNSLGCSTASKAILQMLHTFQSTREEFRRCRRNLENVSLELKELKSLINEKQRIEDQIIESARLK